MPSTHFLAALDIDSTYAAAHAGLALARVRVQAWLRARSRMSGTVPPRRRRPRYPALAMNGLRRCSGSRWAKCCFSVSGTGTGAERSLQAAHSRSTPNHTEAYLHYGGLMEALGRLDRGLQLKQQALERDPSFAMVAALVAVSFWNQRRYDETICWIDKALECDPRSLFAQELRVIVFQDGPIRANAR